MHRFEGSNLKGQNIQCLFDKEIFEAIERFAAAVPANIYNERDVTTFEWMIPDSHVRGNIAAAVTPIFRGVAASYLVRVVLVIRCRATIRHSR